MLPFSIQRENHSIDSIAVPERAKIARPILDSEVRMQLQRLNLIIMTF